MKSSRALLVLLLLCSPPASSQQLPSTPESGGIPVSPSAAEQPLVQDGSAKPIPGVARLAGTPGQQSVTRNQMLVSAKARSAVEKAARAIAHNDKPEAQRQLSRALGGYPKYAVALTLRGLLELNEGRIAAATADLEEATHADPAYGLSCLVLASVYNDAGRSDDALVFLPRAIRLLPSSWQSHFEMARALNRKKDYPAALREVTEALRLTPGSVPPQIRAFVHYLRARILLQLTDSSGAKQEFEQTLKEDPNGEPGVRSRSLLKSFNH